MRDNELMSYFDDASEIKDFDFINVLLDQKSFEKSLIWGVLYKNFIGPKLLRIIFYKLDI